MRVAKSEYRRSRRSLRRCRDRATIPPTGTCEGPRFLRATPGTLSSRGNLAASRQARTGSQIAPIPADGWLRRSGQDIFCGLAVGGGSPTPTPPRTPWRSTARPLTSTARASRQRVLRRLGPRSRPDDGCAWSRRQLRRAVRSCRSSCIRAAEDHGPPTFRESRRHLGGRVHAVAGGGARPHHRYRPQAGVTEVGAAPSAAFGSNWKKRSAVSVDPRSLPTLL